MNAITFESYMTAGLLIVVGIVAAIVLINLLFDKDTPDQIIVADKEGRFFFDAKDAASVTLKRQDGGGYVLAVTKKYKHGYWILELPCESRERGVEMIAAIGKLLPKVETV